MRSVASVCVSVCPIWALTFESLDLETSFGYAGTSSEYLGHIPILSALGQNGLYNVTECTHSQVVCL